MSAQETPQFTPAEVLDAGRRAESESRIDFARQVYTHIARQYPGTAEAGAALQGLARVGPAVAGLPQGGAWPPAAEFKSNFEPRFEPQMAPQPSLGNPFQAAGRAPEPAYSQPQPAMAQLAPVGHDEWSAADGPLPAAFARAGAVELPGPHRDYLTGRLLARLSTWLGVLLLLVGAAIVPLATFSPRTLAGLPLIGSLLGNVGAGLWLVGVGFCQIVLGQVTRALLDQANATRDIAAILRIQAGGSEPTGKRRRRR